MLSELSKLTLRDLDGLAAEIRLYPDDATLWREVAGCPNSGGTLVLHLVGNLRHFVGAVLGDSGYVRQRELEFSTRGLSREELLELVAATRAEVEAAYARLDPARLTTTYPITLGDKSLPTGLFLMHLTVHLGFHLGQIDYHRRAATGDKTSAGVISPLALAGSD